MKKIKQFSFLATLVLLCASFALAQDTTTPQPDQSAPQSDQSSQPQPDQTAPQSSQSMGSNASAGASTIQGCLSGSEGNYMLSQDGTGTMFKLAGGDDQLKHHVGHEVAVTGQMSNADTGNSAQSTGQADSTSNSAGGSNTLQVTDVKMLSKHCSSQGGGSMSH